MRAADVGWVVAGERQRAYACLDFMALRVPVIAERSPLTQHYVADGITGLLLAAGDPSHTASDVADVSRRSTTSASRWATRGARASQREFTESAMIDGFERAVNAAGDRDEMDRRDVTAPPAAVDSPDASRTAREYAALRGAVAAMERLSFVAPGGFGERIGRLGYASARHPSRRRREATRRRVPGLGPRARSSASRARRTRTSDARASRRRFFRRTRRREIIDLFEAVDGWSIVEERLARGKGLIVVTGHLGNWELGGAYLAARRLADRRGGAAHGESAVRSIPHVDATAIGMTVVHDEDGGAPRAALAAHGARGGVSRRSGRGRARVDVGAVLRPLRQDAARSGGVRASARHADRVRRGAAPAVGTVSPRRSSRSTSPRPAIAKPTSIASSPTIPRRSSGGFGARRSSISGIIGAGSISVRERRANSEIRCESRDGSTQTLIERAWFGGGVIVLLVLLAIAAPLVARHDPFGVDLDQLAPAAVLVALVRHRHSGARRVGAPRLRLARLAVGRPRLAGHRALARRRCSDSIAGYYGNGSTSS